MQQIQLPQLSEGETYLCGFVDANGDISHTILLPGDNNRGSWKDQIAWAKSIGGDLPNRTELAAAFAKCPDQFQKAAYWSNEDDGDGWAWGQDFGNGSQDCTGHGSQLRARAVRRL